MNNSYYKSVLQRYQDSQLGKLFILKIVKAKPEGVEIASWMEMIFGLHERDIIQYECLKEFKVPGFYKPVPQVRISGYLTPRTLFKEDRIWVRFDQKYPNVIDLEAGIGVGCDPRIFQLNLPQWTEIKDKVTPVEIKRGPYKRRRRTVAKDEP